MKQQKRNEEDLWKELQECIVVGHLRTANAIIMEWVEQARQQTAIAKDKEFLEFLLILKEFLDLDSLIEVQERLKAEIQKLEKGK